MGNRVIKKLFEKIDNHFFFFTFIEYILNQSTVFELSERKIFFKFSFNLILK